MTVEVRVTLVGLREHVKPVTGETVATRLTVPVKPPMEATVIVEMPEAPATTVKLVGLAAMEKSTTTTLNVTVAERDNDPLVPVTVTA